MEIFTTFAPELKEIFGVSDISEVIQSYNNRISLFTDKASAGAMQALYEKNGLRGAPVGSAHHMSNHKGYTKAIMEKIDEILRMDLSPDKEKTRLMKKTMLIDMQNALRDMLQKGDPSIKADSDNIKQYLDDKVITQKDILEENKRYKHAQELEKTYNKNINDDRHKILMKDEIKIVNGSYKSKKNSNFVAATGG